MLVLTPRFACPSPHLRLRRSSGAAQCKSQLSLTTLGQQLHHPLHLMPRRSPTGPGHSRPGRRPAARGRPEGAPWLTWAGRQAGVREIWGGGPASAAAKAYHSRKFRGYSMTKADGLDGMRAEALALERSSSGWGNAAVLAGIALGIAISPGGGVHTVGMAVLGISGFLLPIGIYCWRDGRKRSARLQGEIYRAEIRDRVGP